MSSSCFSSPLENLSNRQNIPPKKLQAAKKRTVVEEDDIKVAIFPKLQKKTSPFNLLGPWTKHEHLAFLYGLRLYGPGNWKKIAELIPTRDNVQIKSHGQQILKRCEKGVNIFDELDQYFYAQECQQARQSLLVRTVPHGPLWNFHPRVSLMSRQHELRLRPPTDMLDAAFGLIQLSSTPRLFHVSSRGISKTLPTSNRKKLVPMRY